MRRNFHGLFIFTSLLLTLAVFSGGCNGGGREVTYKGDDGGTVREDGARSIQDIKSSLVGKLNATRLNICDVSDYITDVLSSLDQTDNWTENNKAALEKLHVLFVEDVSRIPSGAGSDTSEKYPEKADIR